ncbi:hypothetical protein GCM10017710_26940 [Arthrobacter ramosus]
MTLCRVRFGCDERSKPATTEERCPDLRLIQCRRFCLPVIGSLVCMEEAPPIGRDQTGRAGRGLRQRTMVRGFELPPESWPVSGEVPKPIFSGFERTHDGMAGFFCMPSRVLRW